MAVFTINLVVSQLQHVRTTAVEHNFPIMYAFHAGNLYKNWDHFSQSQCHNIHSFSHILPDSVAMELEPIFVKPRALVPGATLSPVFLSEGKRTFWNPISYLGGPRLQSPKMTRASKESVLSIDWSTSCVTMGSSAAILVGMVLHSPFWAVLGSCKSNLCNWYRRLSGVERAYHTVNLIP